MKNMSKVFSESYLSKGYVFITMTLSESEWILFTDGVGSQLGARCLDLYVHILAEYLP